MGTVTLNIFVQDIGGVISSYDTMKMRRSVTDETGPWSEITAPSPQSATLTAPNSGNYDVVSKTLQLIIDNQAQQNIVFTGGLEPLTVPQVVNQINAVFPGVASDVANYLTLTSTDTGTGSKVEIVGGGAAAEFGWSDGDRDIGEEAYITLVAGQTSYTFVDKDGESGYYYEAAYYNTVNQLQSSWSLPFQGDVGTVIPATNLSKGSVDLVTAEGIAVVGQTITFYPYHDPSLRVEGYGVALDDAPIEIVTDNTGHAEANLVRGLRARVVFEGTSLIREIVVPDEDSFDILTLMATSPDPYGVVDPEIPYAIRRTI